MNKKLPLIVIIILLVLFGIIYVRTQATNTRVGGNSTDSLTTPTQIQSDTSSPAPTSAQSAEQIDIEKDLNEIEKLLNEADASLDDSDLTF